MANFAPAPEGGARLELAAEEARLLRQLATESQGFMRGFGDATDPVRRRLFPSAYEDPDDEAKYREMVIGDLEREKLAGLQTVAAAVSDGKPVTVVLAADEVGAWLAALTDMRLAVGTRLQVDEERMGAEVDPSDPDAPILAVLHWLGWLQEGILSTLE